MNDETPESDRALLADFLRGSDDAATALYQRYARRLHALASQQTAADLRSRSDPEDIVQSVFRTFFRRVQRGEYEVPEGDELWNLFFVIALNKVRKFGTRQHAARRDTRKTVAISHLDTEGSGLAEADEIALHALRLTVDDVLDRFPPEVRQVLALRIEGHEVAAIAEKTGRARRSVERMLQNFRTALASELKEEADDAGR